jgi:glycerol-3-phosphate dehydrogenase subunit C
VSDRWPIWILAPSSDDKRIDTAQRLTRPGSVAVCDDDELRARLRTLRQETTAQQAELRTRLQHSLRARLGSAPFVAADSREAAARVAALCGPGKRVVVNRSAVVQELLPHLAALGIAVCEAYDDQFASPQEAVQRYWEIVRPEAAAAWGAFANFQPAPAPAPEAEFVALLGVNAIAADDGTVCFVQHLNNISEALTRASRVILLIAENKIVPDAVAARLITQAMARFGAPTVALGVGRRGGGEVVPPSPHAPRQEIDLILLDNGRLDWIGGSFESLFTCIGCRACAQECPTYPYFSAGTGWTPRDYLAAFLREDSASLALCTSCGRCGTLCPLDIELPALIARAKSTRPVALQDKVSSHIETVLQLSSYTTPLSNLALGNQMARGMIEAVTGIDHRRELPTFSRPAMAPERPPANGQTVVYYYGCDVNYTDPTLGLATRRILEHNGYTVIIPPQSCCGIAAFACGDWAAARRYARRTLDTLYPLAAAGLDILVTCPSCGLALKQHIPQLLGDTPEARVLAERTREVTTFLLDLHTQGRLRTDLRALERTVGYHVPCHLRARGLGQEVPQLLGLVPGLVVRTIDRGCCGLSGSFGLKAKHYDQSLEIGSGLFAALREDGIDEGTTDCAGCEMQMRAGSGRPVHHPLKLLWESYVHGDSVSS